MDIAPIRVGADAAGLWALGVGCGLERPRHLERYGEHDVRATDRKRTDRPTTTDCGRVSAHQHDRTPSLPFGLLSPSSYLLDYFWHRFVLSSRRSPSQKQDAQQQWRIIIVYLLILTNE